MIVPERPISYTPAQLEALRKRWLTPDGQERRRQIQKMLTEGNTELGDLATFPDDDLPPVPPGKDLRGIILSAAFPENLDMTSFHLSGARLEACDFTGADFSFSHLEFVSFAGSILNGATFTRAFLTQPNFVGADLERVNISEAIVDGVPLISHRAFSSEGFADFKANIGFIDKQYVFYSIIKFKYKSLGKYNEMIPFHLLEMRARRNDRYIDEKTGRRRIQWYLDLIAFDLVCGYGERWANALLSALIVILSYTFLYMPFPLLTPSNDVTSRVVDYLYFSAVTFSNLGSQDLLPYNAYHRFLMFSESVLGLFLVTMIIVIFTRKVIRE